MSTRTIRLECGKALTVSMEASLFELTSSDREIYGAITDLLLKHDHPLPTPEPTQAVATQAANTEVGGKAGELEISGPEGNSRA